jgi:PBSX family phage terminase large subunit
MAAPNFNTKWFNTLYFILNKALKENPKINKVFIYGGKSSSKTYTIAQYMAKECYVKKLDSIAFRKESVTIQTTLKKSFKSAIDSCRLHPAFEEQLFKFKCNNENSITFKGVDSETKLKGIEKFGYILLDEVDQFTKEEFDTADLSFRGPDAKVMFCTWNPISDKLWVKEYLDLFEWNDTDYKLPSEHSFVKMSADGTMLLIKTIFEDNYWTVGAPCGSYGYRDEKLIAKYELLKTTDYASYLVNCLGEWGVEKAERPFFKAIRPHNFGETFYNINEPIWLSWDFNKNATCLISQHYSQMELLNDRFRFGFKRKDVGGVYVLQVIQADSIGDKFKAMVRQVVRTYPNHYYRITGDCSGNAEGTAKEALFGLIQQVLIMEGLEPDVHFEFVGISGANKRHKISYNICNTVIDHYAENFIIDKDYCPILYEDVQLIEVNSQGGIDKSYENKDKDGLRGHAGDCLRYLIHEAEATTYEYLSEQRKEI